MVKVKDLLDRNDGVKGHTITILKLDAKRIIVTALTIIHRELRIELECEITIASVRNSPHGIVPQTHIRGMEQSHITVNSGKTPEVLVLKIRTVAILVHLYGNLILP